MLNKKRRYFKKIAIFILCVCILQCICFPLHTKAAENASQGLITSYKPTINPEVSKTSGLVHPGVGLTKELLNNVQEQVRAGKDPWKTYFEAMLESSAASRTPGIKLTDPSGTVYNSQSTNSKFISDALTAYTQAILYYVTGDNVYRKNAITVFRAWADMNPDSYEYFNDACIHTGIPMNRMCMAAEIIRYSSYELTEGYSETDLKWTQEEIDAFVEHLVKPSVETFMSSHDEFMNQHMYTTLGAMSAYLFMDDAQGYAKTVEWFTVNEEGANPGFNGSIRRLFREITTLDTVGGTEGGGTPLETPVIQHVEMGRDQAHGCGDLTNATIMARLLRGQNTKVDPAKGTISTAADAVDAYEFLDNRILKAADFFFKYTLGYSSNDDWTAVPFSIRDGKIVDMYTAFSPEYRGRYKTINFWDLYTYYTHIKKTDLKDQYPYFYEGFEKKFASNYYWNGKRVINWDNVDAGGDFWLWIPGEAVGDSAYLAKAQNDYQIEVEDRGSMTDNASAMSVQTDGTTGYIRFQKSNEQSRLGMSSSGVLDQQTIAFRIRTDGMATLSLENGVTGSIILPDTGGNWQYVTYTRAESESFGDFYYVIISEIQGSYVDIDCIDIKPLESNADRTITKIDFTAGNENIQQVTYIGAPLQLDCQATSTGGTVSCQGISLPEGAAIDVNGTLTWNPQTVGNYHFYVCASADATSRIREIEITVKAGRADAVAQATAEVKAENFYTRASYANYKKIFQTAIAMTEDGSADEDFSKQLNQLCEAVKELVLLSARLEKDPYTDGTSLDYPQMVVESTMGDQIWRMTDGLDTYCVYSLAVDKAHVLDFGADFKIAATKFGYKARLGFSDRVAGVQIYGSNDNKNWTQLTVGEAQYTQQYQEVQVKEEEKGNAYRYLKIMKTTEYPEALRGAIGNLLEFGEFRIYGERYETGNALESISLSSVDAESGRIKAGDKLTITVTAREAIGSVHVKVQNTEAEAVSADGGITWTAEVLMTENNAMGKIEIAVDYQKADGTAGDTAYATTDGSSLLLIDPAKKINVLDDAESLGCVGNRRGNVTAEQNTKNLFDENFSTFGELNNDNSSYYLVDFGEGTSLKLAAVLFMPRNDQEGKLSNRTSGMKVWGSRDGETWTQLTDAVTDATYQKWSMKTVKESVAEESFRYFKIAGAQFGNAEEVEFYGCFTEKRKEEPSEEATEINYLDGSCRISRFSRLGGGASDDEELILKGDKDHNPLQNLTDQKSATYVEYRHDSGVSPAYLQLDFTENYSVQLDHFTIQARQDQVNRVKPTLLAGSDDGKNWVDLSAAKPQGTTELQTIEIKKEYRESSFRYLRLYNSEYTKANNQPNSFLSIAEFHLYGELQKQTADSTLEETLDQARDSMEEKLAGMTVQQVQVTTQDAAENVIREKVQELLAQIKKEIEGLADAEVTVKAEAAQEGFVAAIEGTADAPMGVDGKFEYMVTLQCGDTVAVTKELHTLTITATEYTIQDVTGNDPGGVPTATPEPTEAPKETATPEPTEAPKETATPEPTEAPEETAMPEPTEAPKETATPEPTEAPKETAAPESTEAPKETAAPEPTHTMDTASTPEPTRSSETSDASVSRDLRKNEPDWKQIQRMIDIKNIRNRKDRNYRNSDYPNINVIVEGGGEIPANIVNELRGKETTLALHVGNQTAFSLTGTNIPTGMLARPIHISLCESRADKQATERLLQNTITSRTISFTGDRECGLMNLHVGLGAHNAGKIATLYRYSDTRKDYVYQGFYPITRNGQAMFRLHGDGDYMVTVIN